MAKGDSNNSQNTIDTQGGIAQNHLNNLWGENTQRTTQFQNNYNTGVNQNLNDYSGIQQQYQNFLNPQSQPQQPKQDFGNLSDPNTWMGLVGNPQQLDQWAGQYIKDPQLRSYYVGKIQGQPGANPTEQAGSANYWMEKMMSDPKVSGQNLSGNNYGNALGSALGGYQNFADTGGFTPQMIQDMRARAIAPTRAIYENAQNNIDRQRALQGGYSPNYTAASAKIARDESNQISNANTNANASLAQLVQQGQLYGLGGLSSTGGMGRGQNLGAIGGQTGLYGSTPGLTNTFGNQVLQSGEQGIQAGGLQNQLANTLIQGQNQHASIPGNFQSGMGNIASLFGVGGAGANLLNTIFGGGQNMNYPNSPGSGFGGPGTSTYNGSDPFGNNLPGYDPIGSYQGGYPNDPSGGTGIGPGMQSYYNGGGPGNGMNSPYGTP